MIDYENIKDLSNISTLSENDTAIIFYSKNANSMTFETHKELSVCSAEIEYKFVDVGGKNALDFQLSTYLGFLINKYENSDTKFFIVSKDNAFSYLKSFWKKEKNINLELIVKLSEKAITTEIEKDNANVIYTLKNSKIKLSDDDIEMIVKAISQYKTKQDINNFLMKYFRDGKKVGSLTKIIKPYIIDKN